MSHRITITIETGNAAFEDDQGGCLEVSQILSSISRRFEDNDALIDLDGVATHDSNGNRVGQIKVG